MQSVIPNIQGLILKFFWDKLIKTQASQYFVLIVIQQFILEIIRIFFSHLINQDLWSLNDMNIGIILSNVVQNSIYIFILIIATYYLSLYLAEPIDYIYRIPAKGILSQNTINTPRYEIKDGNLSSDEAAKIRFEEIKKASDRGKHLLDITCLSITFIGILLFSLSSFNILLALLFTTLIMFFIALCSLRHFFSLEEETKLEFKSFKEFLHHFLLTDFDEEYWAKYDKIFIDKAVMVYRAYLVMMRSILFAISIFTYYYMFF